MKTKLIFLSFAVAILSTSCINDELEANPKDLTNQQRMQQLNVVDPGIWNTLASQSISVDDLDEKSALKSAKAAKEYPKGGNFYFTLFEDLYPSEGDYDFNDVMLKSILGLEKKGNTLSGYLSTTLLNKGGSLPVKIGLMFYEVSGKKYKRIDFDKIIVNGTRLSNKPWTTSLSELGEEWKIEFEFENASANVWVSYFIETEKEIMSSGFAPSDVSEFETPHPKYLSPYQLPWGLEIEAKSLAIPNEKELFLNAYPEFQGWVDSNGVKNKKWYENHDLNYSHE